VPIIPADITLPNQYEKRSTLAPPRHPKATEIFHMHILHDVIKYLYPKNIVSI
jgi:hypothetical protein